MKFILSDEEKEYIEEFGFFKLEAGMIYTIKKPYKVFSENGKLVVKKVKPEPEEKENYMKNVEDYMKNIEVETYD